MITEQDIHSYYMTVTKRKGRQGWVKKHLPFRSSHLPKGRELEAKVGIIGRTGADKSSLSGERTRD